MKVACQNLGPLEKGGAVVGIDTKVSSHCSSFVFNLSCLLDCVYLVDLWGVAQSRRLRCRPNTVI